MAAAGRDGSARLEDGRILEYWDGGDPDGRPVIVHPGTPVTRILGRWAHGAAAAAGARLIAVNRPGYGGSTLPEGLPSLRAVGHDTVGLASQLGIDQFAVVGYSGGGPFAAATAIAAPGRVRALGIVGGSGPWATLRAPTEYPEDRACLAMLADGDEHGAWSCFRQQATDAWEATSPGEIVDSLMGGEDSDVVRDQEHRAVWLDNAAALQANLDGYAFDNLAWGGPWDIDVSEVTVPTALWYGTGDSVCPLELYGRWYADRIRGARLIVLQSPGHVDTCEGHWPEVLAGLLQTWE
jgi:pimeloyl-ACP methyl ester carboxylesterase